MENGYKPHTDRLQRVDTLIREFFEYNLPGDKTSASDAPRSDGQLFYHGIAHTLDPHNGVVAVTNSTAQREGVTELERELLVAAAYFHDTGYAVLYNKNEPEGARIAIGCMPSLGFDQREIETAKRLILVTDITTSPTDLLEKIIRDSDVDSLGRDDFDEISDGLRRELDIPDTKGWYEGQVSFLEGHKYFTDSAKRRRDFGKAENLQRVKKKLKEF